MNKISIKFETCDFKYLSYIKNKCKEDMIGSYDVSTQMYSNNLSTKTAFRSNTSTEETEPMIDQNLDINNKHIRQSRIHSVNLSQQKQYNGIKKTPNQSSSREYYSNMKISQTTKNSKEGCQSFLFENQELKTEGNRDQQTTQYKYKLDNEFLDQSNRKYLEQSYSRFLDKNYTKQKVASKDYSFPVIQVREKTEDILANQTSKSRQLYDQTCTQPIQQANAQKISNDGIYLSQPQINQKQEKQQNRQKTPINNVVNYAKKKIEFLEQNRIETDSVSNNTPYQDLSAYKQEVLPNRNNKIRSQIYQKKIKQYEYIFGNNSSASEHYYTQSNRGHNSQQSSNLNSQQSGSQNIQQFSNQTSQQSVIYNTQQCGSQNSQQSVSQNAYSSVCYNTQEYLQKKAIERSQEFNSFSIMDREAYIDQERVQNFSNSPKGKQFKNITHINLNQIILKPDKRDSSVQSTTKRTYTMLNTEKTINKKETNYTSSDINKCDDIFKTQKETIAINNKQLNQQECFEEMHFFQVEFIQKCKQWMNQLENKF